MFQLCWSFETCCSQVTQSNPSMSSTGVPRSKSSTVAQTCWSLEGPDSWAKCWWRNCCGLVHTLATSTCWSVARRARTQNRVSKRYLMIRYADMTIHFHSCISVSYHCSSCHHTTCSTAYNSSAALWKTEFSFITFAGKTSTCMRRKGLNKTNCSYR